MIVTARPNIRFEHENPARFDMFGQCVPQCVDVKRSPNERLFHVLQLLFQGLDYFHYIISLPKRFDGMM